VDHISSDIRSDAICYYLTAVAFSPSHGLLVYFFVFVCIGNGELDGLFCSVHRFCNSPDCIVDSVRSRNRLSLNEGKYAHRSEWIACEV